jgi:hypothetical protein
MAGAYMSVILDFDLNAFSTYEVAQIESVGTQPAPPNPGYSLSAHLHTSAHAHVHTMAC